MKQTGIIMSGDHPKLILEGRKTMTRRVIKPQPVHVEVCSGEAILYKDHDNEIAWKYRVGDRLWVKEKHTFISWDFSTPGTDKFLVRYSDGQELWCTRIGVPKKPYHIFKDKVRSPLFMPRWASRITREITEVRAERLQSISHDDVEAEGLSNAINNPLFFPVVWDSLNAKRGYPWARNNWVWVIGFKIALQSER